MILTHKQLCTFRNVIGDSPCKLQLDIFKKIFPSGMQINKESLSKCENLDVPRFLEEFAPSHLRKEILRLQREFYYVDKSGAYQFFRYTRYKHENISFVVLILKENYVIKVIEELYQLRVGRPKDKIRKSYLIDRDKDRLFSTDHQFWLMVSQGPSKMIQPTETSFINKLQLEQIDKLQSIEDLKYFILRFY